MYNSHLHIHSGECAASILTAAGTGEPNVVWADVLHIGALDWRWPDALRRAVRAQALCDCDDGGEKLNADGVAEHLRKQDAAIDAAPDYERVTIWVDVCLYDQLILCFLLDRLGERVRLGGRVADLGVVCVGEVLGVPGFTGYGELNAEQMLALLPQRKNVTLKMLDAAKRAWRAAASPERSPEHLRAVAKKCGALEFLPAALERFADEFADADGLNRTDRNIREVRRCGAVTRTEIFRAANALEPVPFMGDATLFARLEK